MFAVRWLSEVARQAPSCSLRPSLGCMCGSGAAALCLPGRQVSQSVWQWLASAAACGSQSGCDARVCVCHSLPFSCARRETFGWVAPIDKLLSPTDVQDIKYVVNFDFPNNTEDYIHRIGRTARAEQTGTAYSFFTSGNAKQTRELIDILKEARQNIPPRLYNMLELSKQIHMAKSE